MNEDVADYIRWLEQRVFALEREVRVKALDRDRDGRDLRRDPALVGATAAYEEARR